MPAAPVLDSFDHAILAILQRDNTTPQRQIAEAVHLSAPAVQRRIKRLQQLGVIRANVAVLDPAALGRPLTLVVEVRIYSDKPHLIAAFRRRAQDDSAVQQCYAITGETDFMLVLTAASMDEYNAISQRLFGDDDNIRCFRTMVALDTLKQGLEVPL